MLICYKNTNQPTIFAGLWLDVYIQTMRILVICNTVITTNASKSKVLLMVPFENLLWIKDLFCVWSIVKLNYSVNEWP